MNYLVVENGSELGELTKEYFASKALLNHQFEIKQVNLEKISHGDMVSFIRKDFPVILIEPNTLRASVVNRFCHDLISAKKFGGKLNSKIVILVEDNNEFMRQMWWIGLDGIASIAGICENFDVVLSDTKLNEQSIDLYKVHQIVISMINNDGNIRFSKHKLIHDAHTVNIKFKKEREGFVLPQYATVGAACFDLVAHEIVLEKDLATIRLGFSTQIPVGYKAVIVPRSSFTASSWVMQNSPGQIDSDYRGEWMLKMRAIPIEDGWIDTVGVPNFPYRAGERVAQCYIERVIKADFELVEKLDDTERGTGGFGSTGK